MLAIYVAYNVIGDAGPLAEPCKVKLPHLAALADVVHQIVGVAFSSQESHVHRS
jgi:hypothetical protein